MDFYAQQLETQEDPGLWNFDQCSVQEMGFSGCMMTSLGIHSLHKSKLCFGSVTKITLRDRPSSNLLSPYHLFVIFEAVVQHSSTHA